MADTFKFELVSPERLLVSADVREVLVPGSEGDFTVLPNHAPLIAMLRPGILRVPGLDGALREIYVRGGLADVGPDSLIVLAEQAMPLAEVNAAVIAREIQAAERDVADSKDEDTRRAAEDVLERMHSLQITLQAA
jgi:F-type H+-transporting ATPase subunit epsilon